MEPSTLDALTQAVLGRIFVPLEASGRHVHLTLEQSRLLFGHSLTQERPLSQPGQYLARERLTIRGPRGEFQKVAVLGPERSEAQVEISLTDARALGVRPPLRHSGNTQGSPGLTLVGTVGEITLEQGVIAALRHIHLDPTSAERFGVKDKQLVSLQACTDRPVCFQEVLVRVREDFAPAAHLDIDEANACGLQPGDLGRMLP